MTHLEAVEILKNDMNRIIALNAKNGKIDKEFDLFQAESLAIQAIENILERNRSND